VKPKKEKKPSYVQLRPEYVRLAGDHATGTFLSQLVYWFAPDKNGQQKLQIQREGRYWLAKDYVEWDQECALSRKQVSRAVTVLRELGIIEVKLWKFNNAPTNHFWLDKVQLSKLLKSLNATDGSTPNATDGDIPNAPVGYIPNATKGSILITETTTETTAEITLAAGAASPPGTIEKQTGKGTVVIKGTAKEILAQMEAKKMTVTSIGVVKPSDLVMRWMKHAGSEGQFIKELTGKQKGQLKMFCASAKELALPAIDFVWKDWTSFTWEVKKQKALHIVPSKPDIGFLQTYHEILLQLIAAGTKAAVPAKEPVAATHKVIDKPTQVCDTKDMEDKATSMDVSATLAALEALTKST
jgi:hypothetical protein